jgi:phosphoglycerol transferase MdoB-like AlkP superfamily enzyme
MDKSKQVVLSGQLKWVERIASVMDDKFRVPGTNFRFGLDPVLNLIPFAGDVSGFIVSAALLYVMAKNGVSRKVLILMAINISIDAAVGAIPLLGQISDFYIKANTRNIKLLKEHYHNGKHTGSGNGIIVILLVVLLIIISLALCISYLALHWLFTQF